MELIIGIAFAILFWWVLFKIENKLRSFIGIKPKTSMFHPFWR